VGCSRHPSACDCCLNDHGDGGRRPFRKTTPFLGHGGSFIGVARTANWRAAMFGRSKGMDYSRGSPRGIHTKIIFFEARKPALCCDGYDRSKSRTFLRKVSATDYHHQCYGSSIVSSGLPSPGWALIRSMASCSEVNFPK
jgi:hypothetical protein